MNTSSWVTALVLLSGLAGCGGGGGGGTIGGNGNGETESAEKTPMQALVVPDAMTWSTAQQQSVQLNVVNDANGAPVADAMVSVFSVSRVGPNSPDALAEPVPEALLDSGASAADGSVALQARLPAHLSEVLIVVSAGQAAVSQVVSVENLGQPLTVRLVL